MRCTYRDDYGTQCRKQANCEAVLWGSDLNPGWFWVALCKTHVPLRGALIQRKVRAQKATP